MVIKPAVMSRVVLVCLSSHVHDESLLELSVIGSQGWGIMRFLLQEKIHIMKRIYILSLCMVCSIYLLNWTEKRHRQILTWMCTRFEGIECQTFSLWDAYPPLIIPQLEPRVGCWGIRRSWNWLILRTSSLFAPHWFVWTNLYACAFVYVIAQHPASIEMEVR